MKDDWTLVWARPVGDGMSGFGDGDGEGSGASPSTRCDGYVVPRGNR